MALADGPSGIIPANEERWKSVGWGEVRWGGGFTSYGVTMWSGGQAPDNATGSPCIKLLMGLELFLSRQFMDFGVCLTESISFHL